MIQTIKKMPTEKIYKKAIEISQELIKLGLTGWQTDLTITDHKKKIATDVKISIKLKKKKLKK